LVGAFQFLYKMSGRARENINVTGVGLGEG
jgi:hypothetical protein